MIGFIKNKKNTNFYFKKNLVWNFLFTLLSYWLFIFTQTKTRLSFAELSYPLLITIASSFILLFTVYYFLVAQIGKNLDMNEQYFSSPESLNEKDRTKLFVNISNFPKRIFLMSIIYYFAQSLIALFLSEQILDTGFLLKDIGILLFTLFYAAYFEAVLNYSVSEAYYSKINAKIFACGIEKNLIKTKKSFGVSLSARCTMFLAMPVLLAAVYTFCIFFKFCNPDTTIEKLIDPREKMIIAAAFNCTVVIFLSLLYYHQYRQNLTKLQDGTINLLKENKEKFNFEISLSNQIEYNIYLLSEKIDIYSDLVDQTQKISSRIFESTNSLSAISNQVAINSQTQNGFVSSFKNTMKDAYDLSRNILNLTNEVSSGTIDTRQNVKDAFSVLQNNINQIDSIKKSNLIVIKGIAGLSDKIKSIDEIASLIYNIAEQTKTVALNARLEAMSASSSKTDSESFNIVSNEIKRLAESTTESIQEIRSYIAGIQQSSKELLSTSEKSTVIIQEESSLISELESQYKSIEMSAENVAEKANDISSTVEEQTVSFRQIVTTLNQISESIESFTKSAQTIKSSIESINSVAKELT